MPFKCVINSLYLESQFLYISIIHNVSTKTKLFQCNLS